MLLFFHPPIFNTLLNRPVLGHSELETVLADFRHWSIAGHKYTHSKGNLCKLLELDVESPSKHKEDMQTARKESRHSNPGPLNDEADMNCHVTTIQGCLVFISYRLNESYVCFTVITGHFVIFSFRTYS